VEQRKWHLASSSIRRSLQVLRASQPFNLVLTSGIRLMLTKTAVRSELPVRHLPKVGRVQRRLPNGRRLQLWSAGDDQIATRVFWKGWAGHEPETAAVFFRLATKARVVIDVGAYNGIYTLLAALANRECQVYAFEPLLSLYSRLSRNVALNRLANVHCIPQALGSTEGLAPLYSTQNRLPSSSSLSKAFVAAKTAHVREVSVPVVTIDGFMEERHLQTVDLMKIDTESTEPDVLLGAMRTLETSRPTIVCEVLKGTQTGSRLERILEPLGYRYYHLTPSGPCSTRTVQGHERWKNYLFAPSSG
jgi:FkbM family methyltransferase